jgi:hypothetical protein
MSLGPRIFPLVSGVPLSVDLLGWAATLSVATDLGKAVGPAFKVRRVSPRRSE